MLLLIFIWLIECNTHLQCMGSMPLMHSRNVLCAAIVLRNHCVNISEFIHGYNIVHISQFLFHLYVLQQSTNLKVEDVQLSMDDLEMIQVIGKGSGGIVQLVRHKWVGTLYALKVISITQNPSSVPH